MPQIKLVPDASIGPADATYGITDASVSGDVLAVRVSYSGGCREHEFELIGSEDPAPQPPGEVRLHLAHNANGDSCKSLVEEELRFDLSPLKEWYRKAFGARSHSVILHLLNRRITYRF